MKEEEKQNDLVMMKRGRTSDSRIVRNSLMWVANDATWDHGGVDPGLCCY